MHGCLLQTSCFSLHTFQSQSAVQSDTIGSRQLGVWHVCVHYIYVCWCLVYGKRVPAGERLRHLQWHGEMGFLLKKQQAHGLCSNIWFSLRVWVGLCAGCYPAPELLQGNEWGWYTERGQHRQINRFYLRKWNLFSQSLALSSLEHTETQSHADIVSMHTHEEGLCFSLSADSHCLRRDPFGHVLLVLCPWVKTKVTYLVLLTSSLPCVVDLEMGFLQYHPQWYLT